MPKINYNNILFTQQSNLTEILEEQIEEDKKENDNESEINS